MSNVDVVPDEVPDTVAEAVTLLAAAGYTADVSLSASGVGWPGDEHRCTLADALVEHTFRFEGASDPGDEAIVLGIRCPDGWRGVLVSAYGPSADADQAALLRLLARPPAS